MPNFSRDAQEVYEALGADKPLARKDFSSDGAYGMYRESTAEGDEGADIRKLIYQTVLKAAQLEKDKTDFEAERRDRELSFSYDELKKTHGMVSCGMIEPEGESDATEAKVQ